MLMCADRHASRGAGSGPCRAQTRAEPRSGLNWADPSTEDTQAPPLRQLAVSPLLCSLDDETFVAFVSIEGADLLSDPGPAVDRELGAVLVLAD